MKTFEQFVKERHEVVTYVYDKGDIVLIDHDGSKMKGSHQLAKIEGRTWGSQSGYDVRLAKDIMTGPGMGGILRIDDNDILDYIDPNDEDKVTSYIVNTDLVDQLFALFTPEQRKKYEHLKRSGKAGLLGMTTESLMSRDELESNIFNHITNYILDIDSIESECPFANELEILGMENHLDDIVPDFVTTYFKDIEEEDVDELDAQYDEIYATYVTQYVELAEEARDKVLTTLEKDPRLYGKYKRKIDDVLAVPAWIKRGSDSGLLNQLRENINDIDWQETYNYYRRGEINWKAAKVGSRYNKFINILAFVENYKNDDIDEKTKKLILEDILVGIKRKNNLQYYLKYLDVLPTWITNHPDLIQYKRARGSGLLDAKIKQ